MAGPIVDLTYPPIASGATPLYKVQLLDANGAPVPAAALFSFTLSIVNTASGAVINGVQDVNVLNAGRGTVDAQGNAVITLLAGDTLIGDVTNEVEYRSLILIWKWNGGAAVGEREVRFAVTALSGT